jgi:flagellar assembly protein FliH
MGEAPRGEEFFPMEISQIPGTEARVDPMFADFGGRLTGEHDGRWHLPAHLSAASSRREARAAEDEEKEKAHAAEREQIREQAFREGLAQGRAEAQAEHEAALAASQQRVREVFRDLQVQWGEMAAQLANRSTQLSLAIAKKLVETAVEINPEYIVSLVKGAVAQAGGADIRKIKVSPQDMEFIEVVGIHKLFKEFEESWSFEADPSIRAGCVVETSAGEIDFDIDRAFERIKEKVVSVARGS